jgi:hypothetical protein
VKFAAAALAVVALSACGETSKADVVAKAKEAYAAARARGVDMSRGPCLGVIGRDWVADVAHDPRRPVDDLPQNQCAAYIQGKVHHFVELDPTGQLIRKR